MTKKIIKICAVLIIGAVLLGACTGNERPRFAGVQQNMDNLNLTGLPIVKEMESFSLLVDDYGNPDKILLPQFERETNVRLDAMVFPTHAAVERKNILLASGNYPDAMGGWLLGPDEIVRLASDEVLIPLGDLIDQYTVNIKEKLNLPGVRRDMTLPDGNIYTVPYLIEEPLVNFHPWINTRWLEDLGLPMPTTTDEFRDTLIAFRDHMPLIGGQRIIPFSWKPNQLNVGFLAGWFGLNASNYFALIDGQLEITRNRPEFREFLRWFAGLYAEGLVDPELFTQDEQTWVAKGRQGL